MAADQPLRTPPSQHRTALQRWWRRLDPSRRVAQAAFPLMAVASAAAFWLATRPELLEVRWWLSLTAFLILACLPPWLYTRFLSVKLTSVYVEYVLNLHRLGVDEPEFLPQPPQYSEYHAAWQTGRARLRRQSPRAGVHSDEPIPGNTIYDAKFESYYGDRRNDSAGVTTFCGLKSLLPVVVCWMSFAIGWLTIFTAPAFLGGDLTEVGLADALRFAFLGAYLFSLQLTVRAFFQNDLRSGTYVAILERLAVSLILVGVAHVVWAEVLPGGSAVEPLVAFVIGSFPLVGQEWLIRIGTDRMGRWVQVLQTRHPLSEIDGMNVWYEARLLEEGIENVQNLATANIVDVVLHSRAPVGRIIDWVDQALLINHLPPRHAPAGWFRRWRLRQSGGSGQQGVGDATPPPDQTATDRDDERFRETLGRLSVRSATDLLDLYAPLSRQSVAALEHDLQPLGPAGQSQRAFRDEMLTAVGTKADRDAMDVRMRALLRCLASEPNLRIVLNWQTGHGPIRAPSVAAGPVPVPVTIHPAPRGGPARHSGAPLAGATPGRTPKAGAPSHG